MSKFYKKKTYSPTSMTEARGAQRAEPEISPKTKQIPRRTAQRKISKPKEKEKQLYHWCHTKGSHRGVTEGFFAENDMEAKRIVETATSANRWKKPWQKQNGDFDGYVKHRGDGRSMEYENQELIKLFKCLGVRCWACRSN